MKYFQNMTDAQIETIVKWLEHQGHDRTNDGGTCLSDAGMVREYCGDTSVRTLYENKQWLVFISIDSGIEVVNAIYKPDMEKSESIELAYHGVIE